MDQNLLAHLRENAAWLIMDPWKKSPIGDAKKYPQLDDINRRCLDKILMHLPYLRHPCISCQKQVFDELAHLPNMYNSFELFRNYLDKNRLNKIVYCGFHYGMCILHNPDGAAYINKKSRSDVFLKWKNAWDFFKGPDWPDECELDKIDRLSPAVREEIMSFSALRSLAEIDLHTLSINKFDVYIKKDLCCLFPESDESEMDELSKKYANII